MNVKIDSVRENDRGGMEIGMEWILNLKQAAQACGGVLKNCSPDEIVKSVITDSRAPEDGCVFIALKGERFDGRRFVRDAVEGGAVCCIVQDESGLEDMPLMVVEDSAAALRDLAAYYREQFDIPVVAVTGSVGKTSTKDMVHSVLSQEFRTLCTSGNFNNEIGLPLTVFRLAQEDRLMVLEMGMSAFGEISRLTRIAKPDTAIITNIGLAHVEHLGSQENIRKAKLEILEGLTPDGALFLNGDDALLWELSGTLPYEVLYYGIENPNCDLVAKDVQLYSDSSDFKVKIEGKDYQFSVRVPGEHQVYNALAAILTGIRYSIPIEKIIQGVRGFVPSGMRQNVIELPCYTMIKDCYNASPVSMKSGLDVLARTASGRNGRKVAILGDMLELGEFSEQAHRDIGKLVCDFRVNCLVTVGEMAKNIADSAVERGFNASCAYVFYNNESAKENLAGILQPGDTILLKASRGMKLEELADYITNHSE